MSELADRLRAEAEHQDSEYDLVVDADLLRAAADELDRLHSHASAGILHRTEPVE